MFEKKDYLEYFDQLLKIEIGMQGEAEQLHNMIEDSEIRRMLTVLKNDEKRHEKIVRDMIKLIK